MERSALRAAGLLAALALTLAAAVPAGAAPLNDDFDNARALEGEQAETAGVTFAATKEPGEPNHAGDPGGASVWFSWTAPRAERVFLQSCSFGWTGVIGVYRGNALPSLEAVASSSSQPEEESCREVRFLATGGTTYRIALDGYSDGGAIAVEQGEYDLRLNAYTLRFPALPDNDAFASAAVLEPRDAVLFGGSTEGATREPGEPGHPSDLAGASLWYRWTAPRTTSIKVFPCLGSFHPVVSVFAGSEIGAATPVGAPAAPGHAPMPCLLGGLAGVGFEAVAGVTYSISVDGANGAWGEYLVALHAAPVPFVDRFPPSTHIRRLRVRGRQATIRFTSGEGSSTFLCRRDKQPFSPCTSPKTYGNLAVGGHRFAVKAVDPLGNADASPAVRRFTVRKR